MKTIKSIIFDWGGVLIDDPAPGLVRYCAKALGSAEQAYKKVYQKFGGDFQKNLLSEEQFWTKMCDELNVPRPKVPSLWGDAFAAVYRPKQDVFALAGVLRNNGFRIAVLSNTEKPAMQFFHQQRYDVFEVLVFSCAEGLAKPEREIYQLTLEILKVEPAQAVFIDDRADYIAGAQAVGLNTILFRDVERLKKELSILGVKIDSTRSLPAD